MSATVIGDPAMKSAQETQPPKIGAQSEVEFAKCECCGLTEECTPAYIERIRRRNQGRWICGLCTEAVKDEIVRSDRLITSEEALNRHLNFCKKFKSSSPPSNPTVRLISAVRRIFRRSLDSPRAPRSTQPGPVLTGHQETGPALTRPEGYFPTISG